MSDEYGKHLRATVDSIRALPRSEQRWQAKASDLTKGLASTTNAECPVCFEQVFLPEHQRYLALLEAAKSLIGAWDDEGLGTQEEWVAGLRRRVAALRGETRRQHGKEPA